MRIQLSARTNRGKTCSVRSDRQHLIRIGSGRWLSDSTELSCSVMSYLKVSGTKIVDVNGQEVILRGAGLGGWMK
jgi:hypothetical protein